MEISSYRASNYGDFEFSSYKGSSYGDFNL